MSGVNRAALAMAALLASLSLVAWRQGRGFDAQRDLEELRAELSMAVSEQHQLQRDIRVLESREWIVEAAAKRLGLRPPAGQVRFIEIEEGS